MELICACYSFVVGLNTCRVSSLHRGMGRPLACLNHYELEIQFWTTQTCTQKRDQRLKVIFEGTKLMFLRVSESLFGSRNELPHLEWQKVNDYFKNTNREPQTTFVKPGHVQLRLADHADFQAVSRPDFSYSYAYKFLWPFPDWAENDDSQAPAKLCWWFQLRLVGCLVN